MFAADALVSTRYTTINILRTIESLLGLKPLSLNDALAAPMADVFDPNEGSWTYRAEAADVLASTELPIPHDRFVGAQRGASSSNVPSAPASYWASVMWKGCEDFRTGIDTSSTPTTFNAALWQGLGNGPEPLGPRRT